MPHLNHAHSKSAAHHFSLCPDQCPSTFCSASITAVGHGWHNKQETCPEKSDELDSSPPKRPLGISQSGQSSHVVISTGRQIQPCVLARCLAASNSANQILLSMRPLEVSVLRCLSLSHKCKHYKRHPSRFKVTVICHRGRFLLGESILSLKVTGITKQSSKSRLTHTS